MINPNCSYSSGEKKNLKGVAIFLKKFLKVLDENNIEHDDESQIRRYLRRRVDIKTTATQFFLSPTIKSNEMIRKNCTPHSCIIIPKSDVPQEFFELINEMEGEKIICNSYITGARNVWHLLH